MICSSYMYVQYAIKVLVTVQTLFLFGRGATGGGGGNTQVAPGRNFLELFSLLEGISLFL